MLLMMLVNLKLYCYVLENGIHEVRWSPLIMNKIICGVGGGTFNLDMDRKDLWLSNSNFYQNTKG